MDAKNRIPAGSQIGWAVPTLSAGQSVQCVGLTGRAFGAKMVVMSIKMARVVVVFFMVFAVGCGPSMSQSPKNTPPEHRLTIYDLASVNQVKLPPQIVFEVFVFETPAENIKTIADAFEMLNREPLRFSNEQAFVANSFLAGFGRREHWLKVAEKLDQADSKRMYKKVIIMFDRDGMDIAMEGLPIESNVSYKDAMGLDSSMRLEPGRIGWLLRAQPEGSLRGVARVRLGPVFRRAIDVTAAQLTGRQKAKENILEFASFTVLMSAGDFIMLGLAQHQQEQMTLGSLLFYSPTRKSSVRTYMIICTGLDR